MTLDECEQHFKALRSYSSPEQVWIELRTLFDLYPVISFKLGRGSVFWRGRRAGSEPFTNISQMSYPPPECTRVGRLNDAGRPCLYAATRRDTVLAELAPEVEVGDRIQLIGFRVKPDHTLRFIGIGELFHVYKAGYPKSLGIDPGNILNRTLNEKGQAAWPIIYIDAFLGNLVADPGAEHAGYITTRLLAKMAFRKSHADGFFYPSVKDDFGMNMAVRPESFDSRSHIVCSLLIQITKVREFCLYDYEILLQATGISETGDFQWERSAGNNVMTMFGLTEGEHDFYLQNPPDGNAFLEMIGIERG